LKTVIVKVWAFTTRVRESATYDIVKKKNIITRRKLTAADLNSFNRAFVSSVDEYYRLIKPLLNRAGFEFDTRLWDWDVEIDDYQVSAIVKMTFVDTNNEGKAVFMRMLDKLGIQFWDSANVIKPYS